MELVRVQQLLLLLDSKDDHLAAADPKRPVHSEPGFGPAKKIKCPMCDGAQTECKQCHGTGRVWVDPMRAKTDDGKPARLVDQIVGAVERKQRTSRPRRQTIPGAKRGKGSFSDDLVVSQVQAAVRARRNRDRSGSYHELELALDALAEVDAFAAHLVKRVLVERDVAWRSVRLGVLVKARALELLGGVQENVDRDELLGERVDRIWRGLAFIEGRMPMPIRVPMELAVRLQGKSINQAARVAGISRGKYKKLAA